MSQFGTKGITQLSAIVCIVFHNAVMMQTILNLASDFPCWSSNYPDKACVNSADMKYLGCWPAIHTFSMESVDWYREIHTQTHIIYIYIYIYILPTDRHFAWLMYDSHLSWHVKAPIVGSVTHRQGQNNTCFRLMKHGNTTQVHHSSLVTRIPC